MNYTHTQQNQKPLSFPKVTEIYPADLEYTTFYKRYWHFIRFFYRKFKVRKQIPQLMNFLEDYAPWQDIFTQDFKAYHALLRSFADNRFSAQEKVEKIINGFTYFEENFSHINSHDLIKERYLLLSKIDEQLSVYISINDIDFTEGFFLLTLRDPYCFEERYYDAVFTFTAKDSILITCIQGPKGENAQNIVRKLTKQMYGIRPAYLLVNCFIFLAEILQIKLLGIPQKNQVKYRWNDKSRLLFNYDQFWQDNHASKQQKYWLLPKNITLKPLPEIQSKKRSMYKKRYELYDQLYENIKNFVN